MAEDFKSSSSLFENALKENPMIKNDTVVKKYEIKASVSLKINPAIIGKIINVPANWSTKPKLDKTGLFIIKKLYFPYKLYSIYFFL